MDLGAGCVRKRDPVGCFFERNRLGGNRLGGFDWICRCARSVGSSGNDPVFGKAIRFVASFGARLGSRRFLPIDVDDAWADVAYVSLDRLPGGVFPTQSYPALAPNLVVEVLSPGNTKAEMTRKRLEYFHHGIQLVWIVDCEHRSVVVYTSPADFTVLGEQDIIDGGQALQGFTVSVTDFLPISTSESSNRADGDVTALTIAWFERIVICLNFVRSSFPITQSEIRGYE